MIFFRGVSVLDEAASSLRARRRSLKGEVGTSAYVVGGDGSWVGGGVSMDWRARQVE